MNEQQMAELLQKSLLRNFEHPDETREFPHGRLEVVRIGQFTIGRAIFEPGWRWSKSAKPTAQTDICAAGHLVHQIAGTMRIRMEDGTEFDCHAGDVSLIPSGHDAWVVGNEPVVIVDFQRMENCPPSKRRSSSPQEARKAHCGLRS